MSRVIQIRDVPEDVHASLTAAAQAQGLSLTRYMLRELERWAERSQAAESNAALIRDAQARIGGRASREEILAALREGRGE